MALESLLIFSYNSVPVVEEEFCTESAMDNQETDSKEDIREKMEPKENQYMVFYILDFNVIVQFRNSTMEGLNIKNPKPQKLNFKDDKLIKYYSDKNLSCKGKKPMTVQRIQDSSTYIMLFPTGLIMQFNSLCPVTKQSQI
jgi:hypothetical protein